MQANVFAVLRIHILSNFPLQLFDENKIPRRNLVFLIQKNDASFNIIYTDFKIISCYLINNIELIDVFVVCRLWIIRVIKIRSSSLYNPLPVNDTE